MENQRIRDICDAAARLFVSQGYAKTQIGHIAKAVGVSVGTIYNDFLGKREILQCVLKSTIDPGFLELELQRPITGGLFTGLEEEIAGTFRATAQAFAAHLPHAGDAYSFRALISDSFDLFSRYAVGCLFIERNQVDFPRLAGQYRQYRQNFFQAMEQYLTRFIQCGAVRPLDHPELTTALIIELLTWWAMDARYVAFQPGHTPPELAKALCMDNLLHAYGQ